MSELRRRFVETLQIAEEDIIFPENPQLFVAIGAALYGEETAQLNTLLARLSTDDSAKLQPSHTLAPLFATEEELAVFRQRHGQSSVEEKTCFSYRSSLSRYRCGFNDNESRIDRRSG